MKEQLEKLNSLVADGKIDLDDFYVVSIHGSYIVLQGAFTFAKALKYKCKTISDNGYPEGEFDSFKVTLT
jgi:hypothetical protein